MLYGPTHCEHQGSILFCFDTSELQVIWPVLPHFHFLWKLMRVGDYFSQNIGNIRLTSKTVKIRTTVAEISTLRKWELYQAPDIRFLDAEVILSKERNSIIFQSNLSVPSLVKILSYICLSEIPLAEGFSELSFLKMKIFQILDYETYLCQ